MKLQRKLYRLGRVVKKPGRRIEHRCRREHGDNERRPVHSHHFRTNGSENRSAVTKSSSVSVCRKAMIARLFRFRQVQADSFLRCLRPGCPPRRSGD